MRKKLLLLPFLVMPLFLTSCNVGIRQKTITNVVVVDGEEIETMRIHNSISDVYKEASKSCVGVYTKSEKTISTGSGVIYKKVGSIYYVVTNQHVIKGQTDFKIFDGDKTYYQATLVGSDSTNDIAVLTFDTDIYGEKREFKPLNIFDEELEDIPTVGQTVIAIGCPLDIENYNSVTAGIVSRYTTERITTDCALNPGNSGGGLFNINGKLLGICNSGMVWTNTEDGQIPVEGEGYAISNYIVKKCITDIENAKGEIVRPVLGITVTTVNSMVGGENYIAVKDYLPLGEEDIAYTVVLSVVYDSLAYEAGILANDVILEINDTKITKTTDIGSILHLANKGDVIKLKIYRKGAQELQIVEITV